MAEFFDRWIEPERQARMHIFCYAFLFSGLLFMGLLNMPDGYIVLFTVPGAIHFIISWMVFGFKRGEVLSAELFIR